MGEYTYRKGGHLELLTNYGHKLEDESAKRIRELEAEVERLSDLVAAYRGRSKQHKLYLRLVEEFDDTSLTPKRPLIWTPRQ